MAGVATAAAQPGVSVVTMSWGFPEGQSVFAADEANYDSVFNVPGVTFLASTGDYGASDPEYPAFSPNVVAVGGTSLNLNADNSYNSETGWGYYSNSVGAAIGSGGGLSLYEPEPSYQQGVQSTGSRTTPDVSMVADPATGAWIADSYNLDPSNPFEVVGGTSLSAPAFAGLVALVNQGRVAAGEATLNSSSPTETQQALYSLPQADYNSITSGSNGYNANAGYNLVTGLGTPVANLMVPDLIDYQGPGTTYAGPTVGPLQDATLDAQPGRVAAVDVSNAFNVFSALTMGSSGFGQPGPHGRPADRHADRRDAGDGRGQPRRDDDPDDRPSRPRPGRRPATSRPVCPLPRSRLGERIRARPGGRLTIDGRGHDRAGLEWARHGDGRLVRGAVGCEHPDHLRAAERVLDDRRGKLGRPHRGEVADGPGGRFGPGRAGRRLEPVAASAVGRDRHDPRLAVGFGPGGCGPDRSDRSAGSASVAGGVRGATGDLRTGGRPLRRRRHRECPQAAVGRPVPQPEAAPVAAEPRLSRSRATSQVCRGRPDRIGAAFCFPAPSAGRSVRRSTGLPSPCLGWRIVSPCGARLGFFVSHYMTVFSPSGGAGGRWLTSFSAFSTNRASGQPPASPRRSG